MFYYTKICKCAKSNKVDWFGRSNEFMSSLVSEKSITFLELYLDC